MGSRRSGAGIGWLALAWLSALAAGCASGACELNSQCNPGTYCGADQQCRYDCVEERDCEDGFTCNVDRGRCMRIAGDAGVVEDAGKKKDAGETIADAGLPPVDVGVDVPPVTIDVPMVERDVPVTPTDVGFPPVDVGFPVTDVGFPPVDMGFPPVDTGPTPGTARYLDPCTTNADCMTGECLELTSGARYCTRRCATSSECAEGFVCSIPPPGGTPRCVPDDTGTECDARTAVPCARYCVGSPVGGAHAHCTHECRSALDCPAGYGCQDAGGGTRVCISAEQPCSRASDCTTNICVGMAGGFQGCTSRCTSDSDCPRRMLINDGGILFQLPPYRCQVVEGERICVPPFQAIGGDLLGSVALGGSCGSGPAPLCRSGVCDSDTNTCVQGCTPTGGCPSGFACRPWVDGTDIYLVCRRSVTGGTLIGRSCAIGADCTTGLCQGTSSAPGSPAYCTRFCNDRLCPTGMMCRAIGSSLDGTMISLCQP